jgi:hypothetical protein
LTEELVYLATIALFSAVIVASARMPHDMLLLACIPPVFVALVMGFVMTLYALDGFGLMPAATAVVAGGAAGWWPVRRLGPKDLLIAIYLAWAVALVLGLIGFGFPDRE